MNENEIERCIEQIEREIGKDVSWSFCKITNDRHAQKPYGKGYGVTINGWDKGGAPVTVFEKATDFQTATEKVIIRYKQKNRQ